MSHKSQSKTRAFWPVIGFVLAVSLGVLAWALGPAAYEFLRDNRIINFSISNYPRATWELIITGVLFVVMLMFASLVVAAARPRQKSEVREKDLVKERDRMVREQKAKKILQREINRQMKDR
ncbi:MAG: hypothetical protein HZC41_15530 [Chloroflexi bacterium]|nr:hypothetical protein [Chloroflexota bacterium]